MLRVNRGSANNLAMTGTEGVSIANPVFLLRLKKAGTNDEFACIVEDTSPNPLRYNLFVLTESNTPDPLNADLTLQNGRYTYWLYEQSSTTNLDYNNTISELETGILWVGNLNVDTDVQVISEQQTIRYVE